MTTTFLDALVDAITDAGRYNKNDQVPPAAILWTDEERQWAPLLPLLRARLPLLTLGDYDPETRTGPAYYLRCMIARTLDDKLPEDAIPVLYLPGVSRPEMRAVEECPKPIQPLAELQYRGVFFTHKNGKDWTVSAFLQSAEGGLDIPVAGDSATRRALLRALLKLAHEPVAHLRRAAPLKAAFFNELLNPDEVRRLLLWLNDPVDYHKQLSPEEWKSFCELCAGKYEVHPETDGAITAARKLGERYGPWARVWTRFEEAPDAYPTLPALLDRARPPRGFFDPPAETWPEDNRIAEEQLREALAGLGDTPPYAARETIEQLEAEHGQRRNWIWARQGKSPLAMALEHLHALARATRHALAGADLAEIMAHYTQDGWRTDAAALAALQAVGKKADVDAVKAALVSLYRPWLEDAAERFQQVVAPDAAAYLAQHNAPAGVSTDPEAGVCLLFCDALRFDAGQHLASMLREAGLEADVAWRLAALPPVTSTAKPAVSPVADRIRGHGKRDLVPVEAASETDVSAEVLRRLLGEAGYQVLRGDELGDPGSRAWTEFGAIDAYGHEHGWKVAHHLAGELAGLAERVQALLDHGWPRVVIVTDHGWLMLPGGLPKTELPIHLTQKRKGRCAVLKEGADVDQQTVPWRWDERVQIAMAPGISCYEAGKEYEHGGLSPQECITPVITVVRAEEGEAEPLSIERIQWKRLRCTVKISGGRPGLRVDVRTRAGDPGASLILEPKAVEADGQVSLLVEDEDMEGVAAIVVAFTPNGAIHAQQSTIIGG
jgi:hypothetical protein